MKRSLSTELRFLEAGLAGYMLRISPNDKHNDELLEHLSKGIEMAEDLERKLTIEGEYVKKYRESYEKVATELSMWRTGEIQLEDKGHS